MPKKLAPHLRSLSPALAASLSPETSRALSDFRLEMEREGRALDAGGWNALPDGIPPFLRAVDAEAPGAADLWRRLPAPGGGATAPGVRMLGRQCGLSPDATRAAVDALRRAELVGTGPRGIVALGPAGVRD